MPIILATQPGQHSQIPSQKQTKQTDFSTREPGSLKGETIISKGKNQKTYEKSFLEARQGGACL